MNLGPNALAVLEKRYLARGPAGELVETADGLFRRVARAVAAADRRFDAQADPAATEERFYRLMTGLDFLPNSPTLMNAGGELGQLSACFVLPVEDSMEAIFEAIKQAALIHKSGGGTGFSFSRLRPAGSTVRSTGGVASGPVSFLRVFNMATEAVKQGGTRRGANMGVLRVDHPDILGFIACKEQNAEVQNFNLSVGLTEDFLEAVESGGDYPLRDPLTGDSPGSLSAREVFERMVDGAWRNGEPGILFLDRLNRDNPVPSLGEIESTNPCGEQPLLPYESCNLGSINLLNMLAKTAAGWVLDKSKLAGTVRDAVHFLDNVIEINRYPLERIAETTLRTRKIGLGVMGFADLLLRLGLPYDSDEAVALGSEIMELVQATGRDASRALAAQRGAFPEFQHSIFRGGPPLRNATITTIAPTGTLSILAGVSSGVEPVFAYAYIRNIMDNTELLEANPILREELEARGLYTEELMRRIAAEGSLAGIESLPEDLRRVFVAAHDIPAEAHLRMQAAFQQHTDNAVSKTVNLRHDATREEVAEVYRLAWRLGCKGVTVYRDGSREGQTLNIGAVRRGDAQAAPSGGSAATPRPRPESVRGVTKRVRTGCGNLYVTVNYDDAGICEVFTSTGKAGGCPSQSEATARLASLALRSGVDVDSVIRQLRGIRCPSTIRRPELGCTSCPDAIARVIREVDDALQNGTLSPQNPVSYNYCPGCGQPLGLEGYARICPGCDFSQPAPVPAPPPALEPAERCPDCGEPLERQGGCVSCRSCGFSKCS